MLDVTGDVDADAFKSIEGRCWRKSSLIVDKKKFLYAAMRLPTDELRLGQPFDTKKL